MPNNRTLKLNQQHVRSTRLLSSPEVSRHNLPNMREWNELYEQRCTCVVA